MKIKNLVLLLAVFCFTSPSVFSQARRPVQTDDAKKANKRPVDTKPKTTSNEAASEEIVLADESSVDEGDVIEVSTEVVNFPVKVIDRKGRFVGGLAKENFKVFEGDKEQPIEFFNNEQQPFTVALVLDMSYSATFKINEIQAAAMSFIDRLKKDDKVMIVSFAQDVIIGTEPTSDRQRIFDAIKKTKIEYGTSLYDSIDLVINNKFKKINGRKAVILFTDGVDTSSERASDFSNLDDVSESDVLVYPIKYDTYGSVQQMKNQTVINPPGQSVPLPHPIPGSPPSPFPFPIPAGGVGTADTKGTRAEDYQKAGDYLNGMANRSGGQLYEANSLANLERAFSAIASELREYYSLGYYLPEGVQPGEKRRVKIKVDQEKVAVKARDYYVVRKKAEKAKGKK